jgi:tRNA(fMet)-specific endonuclease VapC
MRAGHAGVTEAIARATAVQLPAIVLGELHAGFALGRRRKENEVALADFLEEPFVSVLDVTAGVARRYGDLFSDLRRAGTPVPVNDIWIAASTLVAGALLLTFDRDFERFAGLDRTVFET